MGKSQVYKEEYEKLSNIFQNVEEDKKQLAEGLIKDAAFLFAENTALVEIMEQTGMVRVHPENPTRQKTTEVSKQYLKNVNTYSTVIKTLNSILSHNAIEEEDAFETWMKEKQAK
ncbi:hypothetical protein SH1V18_15010 [Vallitalea longa]|uniref:Uncharacterized protein n=1 Tax=Vallitalea longa TaxID=2936439 RepID=A0A9W5YAN9_9FIRM|nr:hypothetical protein [Vallitalea longa]GKX29021.1 hypothetical protein SH1V18_15010 [Vallitalea longa]